MKKVITIVLLLPAFLHAGNLHFTENKGQLADLKGAPVAELLFKASVPGLDLYVTTWGLSYVFLQALQQNVPTLNPAPASAANKRHQNENTTMQYCRADMVLEGATIKSENILKEGKSEDRTDYYLSHCPDGIKDVRSYDKITVKNIYPGIDWVVYTDNPGQGSGKADSKSVPGNLKYDFIVHTGADPNNIRIKYNWTDPPELKKGGSLRISTPQGNIAEGIPYCFQAESNVKVSAHYLVGGSEIKFSLGKYDNTKTLTIDPALTWATYYGTPNVDEIYSISEDGSNIWTTGFAQLTGFPIITPPGGVAFMQGTCAGQTDIVIFQFTSCGDLVWSTYYGGSSFERAYSISSDGTNVWLTGFTASADFPVQASLGTNAYNQPATAGYGPGFNYNAFVLEFNCTTEAREWATYLGGSITNGFFSGDVGNSICSDGADIWVTGQALSTNFPTQFPAGSFKQSTLNSPNGNVFISKFSCASNSMLWSTYFGGSGLAGQSNADEGASISSDGHHVWVTGQTISADFPVYNPGTGYYQANLGGTGINGFVLKFDCSVCSRQWASYLGGNTAPAKSLDFGTSINSDGINVWVTGQAASTDFPTVFPAGSYQHTLAFQSTNAFISQFDCGTNAMIWSTYYGGSESEEGTSIQSDKKYVWVSGTSGSSDFPVFNGGCNFNQPAQGDAFILQFTTSGARQWATYYGNENQPPIESEGSYICSDGYNVYITGDDYNGATYPAQTLAGAYSNTSNAGGEVGYIGKFSIVCPVSSSLVISNDTTLCAGGTATLHAGGGLSYSWSPAAGLNTTAGPVVKATPSGPGMVVYTVTSTSSVSCVPMTATVSVTASEAITPNASQSQASECGNNIGIAVSDPTGGSGIYTYDWSNMETTQAIANLSPGNYTVTVTDQNGCSATAVAAINSTEVPAVSIVGDQGTCQGKTDGEIDIASTGAGDTYTWSAGVISSSGLTAGSLASGSYTVTVTGSDGCTATASAQVAGFPDPVVYAGVSQTINKGDHVVLEASGGSGYSWNWSPSGSLSSSDISNPVAGPLATTTYTVTITDAQGCTAIDSVRITVTQCDAAGVYMPTAFSPNNDGTNDVLSVRAPDCIVTMKLLIFDRWGELVFESTSPDDGWDGTYKGKVFESGVFVYYLDLTLSNGQAVERKGNITLLR